jgi:hypothetical protein
MSINIENLNERELKALTGLSKLEFKDFAVSFNETYHEIKQKRYEDNKDFFKRKPGNGAIGKLETTNDKLFFILYYLKVYPTFDVLGFTFNMKGKNAHKNVVSLFKVLEMTLRKLEVLPMRKFDNEKEFKAFLKKHGSKIIIDATERSHHRKNNNDEQKKYYNGKKNDIL